MPRDTHEEVPPLTTKIVSTMMGDHIDGSTIHYGINVPQFQYYGFYTVGPEFDEDMLMNIDKTGTSKTMINSTIIFRMKRGGLKGHATELRTA